MPEIEPCPECGYHMPFLHETSTHYEDYYVLCMKCDYKCPVKLWEQEAIEAWNQRASESTSGGSN